MPNAVIETSRGTITVSLFAKDCPKTVANFTELANSAFYDGQRWHRVIANFMIQGGDPYSKTGAGPVGTGGPGYACDCEIRPSLKHAKGSLSMAHAGTCKHDKSTGEKLTGRCSNGSQFFITHVATPHLDGIHTIFGQVSDGQAVVDAIKGNDEILKIRVNS